MWHSASNVLTRKMLAIDSFLSKDLSLAQYLVNFWVPYLLSMYKVLRIIYCKCHTFSWHSTMQFLPGCWLIKCPSATTAVTTSSMSVSTITSINMSWLRDQTFQLGAYNTNTGRKLWYRDVWGQCGLRRKCNVLEVQFLDMFLACFLWICVAGVNSFLSDLPLRLGIW